MRKIECLAPEKLGLVIIDMQRGYCDPISDCATILGWDVLAADQVCRAHVPFLTAIRKLLKPEQIMWIRNEEKLDTILPNLRACDNQLTAEEELCVRGTPGHDYHVVKPATGEAEFLKFHPNAFTSPEFRDYLSKQSITQLAFTGVIGSRCVNATIVSASERGFECIALLDLIGGPERFKTEIEHHVKVTTHLYALPLQSQELVHVLTSQIENQ